MSNRRIWEQCVRLLLLNPIAEANSLCEVLHQVFTAIVENPQDNKYKILKFSNKHVQNKILSRRGGLEILIATGFENVSDSAGNRCFVLQGCDLDEMIATLIATREWLQDTLLSLVTIASRTGRAENEPCCDIVVQIKLPTGKLVQGGFLRDDLLEDVRSYASSYFLEDRQLFLFHTFSPLFTAFSYQTKYFSHLKN